ncbi:MAG TPA: histidine phosphatase family protein [Acidimicrobiales bacterium]|nr:histidine phosphatase family protein [Acidimicrobiales bacterium]
MLILVRHGQTATNAEGRLLGRADPPLTALGEQQAAAAAVKVGSVARVISSPLQRAQATAACFGRPVEIDERWIELDYGALENSKLGDVNADFWTNWREDPSLSPPGGESLTALGARVRAACEDLVAQATTEDVVVVSHVSPIKAAVSWALGGDDTMQWRMFLDVAAVSRVAIRDHGPVLVSFGERVVVT